MTAYLSIYKTPNNQNYQSRYVLSTSLLTTNMKILAVTDWYVVSDMVIVVTAAADNSC